MSELIFPGTGSALTRKEFNWNNNLCIRRNGKNFAVDYGKDGLHSFRDIGVEATNIDGLYVTHIHNDHVGGIADIAIATKFARKPKPKLFCEEYLLVELWSMLTPLLSTLEGITWTKEEIDKKITLGTYFDVRPVKQNQAFEWEGITFDILSMIHAPDRYRNAPCYGLMWTDPETSERILYTADVQFCPHKSMTAFYEEADHIFQDCETSDFKSEVHAHFNDLATLPAKYLAKMWFMHSQDNVWSNLEHWQEKARAIGARGFVPRGTIFTRSYTKLND